MTYAETLSKMIACETISTRNQIDKSKFYGFHKILEQLFPNIHKKMEKLDFDGSLLFKLSGTGKKDPVLLMSHMDVVEATGTWTQPPFSGLIDDKRVWGRGTLDTKGSLFALMQAVEELLEGDLTLDYDLYIASSCTEEVGGEGGIATAQYLEQQGVSFGLLIDEGGAIMPQPVDGVKGDFAMIGVVEKGGGDLKFTARSAGGHSSAPPKHSPIARLAQFINHIETKKPFKAQFSKEVKTMFQVMAPHMDGGKKFLFNNMWLTGGLLKKLLPDISSAAGAMLKTTVAFTMQSGSQGANVLPLEASVVANMRYIPHQNMEESIKIITDIAKQYDLEVEVLSANPSTAVTDIDGSGYQLVKSVVQSVFPHVVVAPYVMVGATDSRFYAKVSQHTIRFAPIFMDKQQFGSIHAVDENVFIDSLAPAVEFYKQIVLKC